MWNNPRDVSRVASTGRGLRSFPPPLNTTELIPSLEKFYQDRTKQKLTDKWAKPNALELFDDYQGAVLMWVQSKWRSIYGKDNDLKSAEVVDVTTIFVFDPTKHHNGRLSGSPVDKIIQKMNRDYSTALLYHIRTILSPKLLSRVQHFRLSVDEPDQIPWNAYKEVCLENLTKPDPCIPVSSLFSEIWRKPKSDLLDWVINIASYRRTLIAQQDTLSDNTYIALVKRQMSTEEKKLVEEKVVELNNAELTTFDQLHNAVKALGTQGMPQYIIMNEKDVVDLLTSKPYSLPSSSLAGKRSKPIVKETAVKGPTCSYCNHPTSKHIAQNCRKRINDEKFAKEAENNTTRVPINKPAVSDQKITQKKPAHKRTNKSEVKCYTCGKLGHYQSECPKKGLVSTFLAQVNAADELCESYMAELNVTPLPRTRRHATGRDKDEGECKPDSDSDAIPELVDNYTDSSEVEGDCEPVALPLTRSKRRSDLVSLALAQVKTGMELQTHMVGLDSFCSHDIFGPNMGEGVGAAAASVRGYGGSVKPLRSRAKLALRDNQGNYVEITGYRADAKEDLPSGCDLLLSKSTMKRLKIDLNHHMYSNSPVPLNLRYLIDPTNSTLTKKVTFNALPEASVLGSEEVEMKEMSKAPKNFVFSGEVYDERKHLPAQQPSMCGEPLDRKDTGAAGVYACDTGTMAELYITEAKVREYLARDVNKLRNKRRETLDDIDYNSARYTAEQITKLKNIFYERKAAFGDGMTLPPAIDMPPHEVLLKPNVEPCSVPVRPWPPAKKEYLTIWAKNMLASGLYEWAELSRWSSRVHLAGKEGPRGYEKEKYEIRPVGDFPAVNDRIQKMAPNLPPLAHEVEKHGQSDHWFETDGLQAFNQIPLAENSRDPFTLMTPIGKIRPTRLTEGSKNAATVLQAKLNECNMQLPQHIRERVSNYMDDYNGGSRSFDDMCEMIIAILDMFIANKITGKFSKTRVGYETATFGGFEVGKGTKKLAMKHMEPLLNMREPEDVPELRRCLGVFVQQKKYIKNYSVICKPLSRLTGKVEWRWGVEEQSAFKTLLKACCERPCLANPDYEKPFFIDPDASKSGHGFCLYQKQETNAKLKRGEQEGRDVIMYGSKAWPASMMMRPIFYLEGHALFYAIYECRYYIDSSKFVTKVLTDHLPLKWIRHSTRGLLTPWTLEKCAGLTYEIMHQPGEVNIVGDAMSRAPFLDALAHTPDLERTIQVLLDLIDPEFKNKKVMWVNFTQDTRLAAAYVQRWRTQRNPIDTKAVNEANMCDDWDLAILKPPADAAPEVCRALLHTQKPFACLLPNDLVTWISLDRQKRVDEKVLEKVNGASKVVSLSTGLTWLVRGAGIERELQLFTSEVEPDSGEDDATGSDTDSDETNSDLDENESRHSNLATEVGDVKVDWVPEQQRESDQLKKEAKGVVVTLKNGILVDVVVGETAKVLVPYRRREILIESTHKKIGHRGYKKTLEALRVTYTWKGMPAQVKRIVEACHECANLKGRRNLAHGQFSSVLHEGPRLALALDFYGVAESAAGYKNILTVMDLYSREVMFIALKNRTAEEVVLALLNRVIYQNGVPDTLMSDEAQEFVGKLVTGLCAALGISRITTKGYDARRNAICERVHDYLGDCLIILSEDLRDKWELHVDAFAFNHNTVIHMSTGLTPFELGHGAPARTLVNSNALSSVNPDVVSKAAAMGYYGRLKEANQAYRAVAERTMAQAQQDQNARLNSRGRVVTFKVGDVVKIVMPAHAITKGWKKKHLPGFRGPMEVIEKPTSTTYKMKDINTGQVFQRSVTNVQKYKAPIQRKGAQTVTTAETKVRHERGFTVNDMVACVDDEGDSNFWVARIIGQPDNNSNVVHYWGTRGAALKHAVFKPAYIGSSTGKTILAYTRNKRDEKSTEWTGVLPDNLVIGRVKLLKGKSGQMKIAPKSQAELSNYVMARL